ncbi:unnamed protein product [Urochloa humidicola]
MKRRSPPSTGGASPRSPLRRQCVAGGKVPWDSCFSPRLMIHKQQAMAGRWHHGSPMSGIYKTHFVMMAGRQRTAKAIRHSGFSISRSRLAISRSFPPKSISTAAKIRPPKKHRKEGKRT